MSLNDRGRRSVKLTPRSFSPSLCAYPTENPTLSHSERQAALDKVVPSSSILSNLLSVLSENGRLSQADKVFADFNTLMAAYRGELEVIVTSAEPLDSKTMNRVEKALKGSSLADGKTLKFTNKVNPSVLGGLLVDIGDKTIDATAATRVNRYSSALARESDRGVTMEHC